MCGQVSPSIDIIMLSVTVAFSTMRLLIDFDFITMPCDFRFVHIWPLFSNFRECDSTSEKHRRHIGMYSHRRFLLV